jgi:hypothetical protein
MKAIILILTLLYCSMGYAQVGAPLTVRRSTKAKVKTIKDGPNTIKWFTHEHSDEVFIYYGKHKKADAYAVIFKDSAGMATALRIRDSIIRIPGFIVAPGGMDMHSDKESIYWERHPAFIATTRDSEVSPYPAFIWTYPNQDKLKTLKADRAKVDSTQKAILRQLKNKGQ